MCRLMLFAVLTLTLLKGTQSQSVYDVEMFNCFRSGISCLTPSTTGICTAGECVCEDDYEFPDPDITYECLETSQKGDCDTDLNCQNGGVCHKIGTVDTCFCTQDYTGDECQMPRVQLECNAENMEVTIRPHGTFAGTIYPLGKFNDADCEFPALTTTGTLTSTSQTFQFADPDNCGIQHTPPVDPATDNSVYKMTVIVQYSTTVIMRTDQALELTCTFNPVSQTTTVEIEDNFVVSNLNPGDISEAATALLMTLFNDGEELTTTPYVFDLGDPLQITWELQTPNTPGFTAVRFQDLFVKLNVDSTGDDSIQIMDQGCFQEQPVVSEDDLVISGTTLSLGFNVFLFANSLLTDDNTVTIQSTVKQCTVATECAPRTDCPTNKRRRRAAGDDEVKVTEGIFVRIGNKTVKEKITETKGKSAGVTDAGECFKNPEMQAVVSVLGLLVIGLFFSLIVVVFVACCRSRRRQGKSVDDDRSTTSSTQKLDWQIPRPQV